MEAIENLLNNLQDLSDPWCGRAQGEMCSAATWQDLLLPTLNCEFSTNQPSFRYFHLIIFPALTAETNFSLEIFFSLPLFALISVNPR